MQERGAWWHGRCVVGNGGVWRAHARACPQAPGRCGACVDGVAWLAGSAVGIRVALIVDADILQQCIVCGVVKESRRCAPSALGRRACDEAHLSNVMRVKVSPKARRTKQGLSRERSEASTRRRHVRAEPIGQPELVCACITRAKQHVCARLARPASLTDFFRCCSCACDCIAMSSRPSSVLPAVQVTSPRILCDLRQHASRPRDLTHLRLGLAHR